MLRVLINRFNPKASATLISFLPKEEQVALSAVDVRSEDLKPILHHPHNSLSLIHYSWIKPLIDQFPERLQDLTTSALASEQIAGLKTDRKNGVPNLARSFIINHFCYQLKIDERIPLEYLPVTEFSPLAAWTKDQMVELIDFLGLYDLASEVRQIVNRDQLKNIYACLNQKQFRYLKICLTQKEQLVSPKLGIDPSKQECAKLKQILHRRGLTRLAKALCGQHPDLIWYLAHILDMGRGSILLKDYLPQPIPKITQILKQQVTSIMNFLKKE